MKNESDVVAWVATVGDEAPDKEDLVEAFRIVFGREPDDEDWEDDMFSQICASAGV